MSQNGKGFLFGPGEPDDDSGDSIEEHLRRLSRRLRGSASLGVERPPAPVPDELRRREAVRVRALSLLGVMRPELRNLDALSYGEALEKVCDAIVDLWICEECHEEGDRCTCLADGRWERTAEGWSDEGGDWSPDDEDEDDEDGPDDDRPYPFLPPRGGTFGGG